MEEDLPSQYRPIPWGFRGTCTPLHGVRMDAERKRPGLRCEKSKNQPSAIGMLISNSPHRRELTQF